MEEIKCSKKYDRGLTMTEIINRELKHVYSIYYIQCIEDIKSSFTKDTGFKVSYNERNLIKLYKILQNMNFIQRGREVTILTLWNAKRDCIKLCQQKDQSVQEYYKWLMVMKEVNETLGANIQDGLGFIEVIAP
jgi:hypothetical protein